MLPLIIVDNPKRWPFKNPGALLISARSYLTDPHFSQMRRAYVFNLCRSYRYQSTGYYVSLLAMARGHVPLPSVTAIQDMKSLGMIRLASDELDDLLQRSLRPLQSDTFTLSIYFGRNLAKRYAELSRHLFRLYQAPLLRADFARDPTEGWRLRNINPIAANDIPDSHHDFLLNAARQYFAQDRRPTTTRRSMLFNLAILTDPAETTPPSNARALNKFVAAARRQRVGVELLDRDDIGRLAEFDGLFIRATTAVNHYTFRFARRAVAEGLVVIDDPDSIVKCANKVYLAELLEHHKVPRPQTCIVHRDNRDTVIAKVGLPCVLKQPDSSFSQGVTKVESYEALQTALDALLDDSDLVIAQQYLPTAFDWRIVVLDREPLLACRYHMATNHWQIIKRDTKGRMNGGAVTPVPLADVPAQVLKIGVRAARLIGDGLYGVDVKQIGDTAVVIEVNDNPNLDAGYEDRLLKSALYDRLISVFVARMQQRRGFPDKD